MRNIGKNSSLRLYCIIVLFGLSFIVYGLLTYGGVRAADSEIVFRTAESLATQSSFAVSDMLAWKGFGLAQGKSGERYSLFGPGQALVCAPFIKAAKAINKTGWYQGKKVPISHYVDKDFLDYANSNIYPQNVEPHALRFIISFFNVLVTSITVVLFFLLMERLTQSVLSAAWVALLFAFGTLMFPYSGTFLSEPLTTLLLTGSFWNMLYGESRDSCGKILFVTAIFLSGLLLGLATAVHITVILFVPFFFTYVVYSSFKRFEIFFDKMFLSFAWVIGLMVPLIFLGYHNYARFGNIFESGRTADPNVVYGTFVAPWRGLAGLLWSGGKGIIWYSPAVVVGLLLWGYFYKNKRFLSIVLLCCVLFRFLFIASRSDWHGGFCVGPRYMLMLTPFLLIPFGFYMKEVFIGNQRRKLFDMASLSFLFISEQIFFCLGEIFSFLHMTRAGGAAKGFNVFRNDFIYFDWNCSPLLWLLHGERGPWVLQQVAWSNGTLLFLGMGIAAFCVLGLYLLSVRFCNNSAREKI